MRRYLLIVLLYIFMVPAVPAQLRASRSSADTFLTRARIDNIIARLEATRQSRRYRQCKVSHTNPPADGASTAPDRLGDTTNVGTAWSDLGISFPATWAVALEIQSYRARCGDGYVLLAYVREAGVTYVRSVHVGGCDFVGRSFPWTRVSTARPAG